MRFEYLISKTRGEGEGMAGSPERGEEGSSGPRVPLWLLSRVLRAGGWGKPPVAIVEKVPGPLERLRAWG